MKIEIQGFNNGEKIPEKFAMGKPDESTHATFSNNINPKVSWSEFPDNTKSFALVCVDVDVPSVGDDVNQEGKTVPHDLPRADFYHWLLVDIPNTLTEITEGQDSNGVTAKGKNFGDVGYGKRGINSYTGWFAGDENMGGKYGGYDGPFPPWNDERLHHYHFIVYALDVPSLDLNEEFTGQDVVNAVEGHVLDKAEWVGTYSLNPNL